MKPPLINRYETSDGKKADAIAQALRLDGVQAMAVEGAHDAQHAYTVIYNGTLANFRKARARIEDKFPSTEHRQLTFDQIENSFDHDYLLALATAFTNEGYSIKMSVVSGSRMGYLNVSNITREHFSVVISLVKKLYEEESIAEEAKQLEPDW